MKKFNFRRCLLLGACLVVVMCLPAWGRTIKIGVIGPMQFLQGKGTWNGAVMAMEEINARGGVLVGKEKMKIELVKADSNEFLNITDATNAMERLITQAQVDFVVGGARAEAVFPMQDIAMDNNKIFFSTGPSEIKLCDRVAENYNRYKYFFRGTAPNNIYLEENIFAYSNYGASVIKKELKVPIKCAIVAEKTGWGDSNAKATETMLAKLGMEVVGVWRPSAVATDVTSELYAIQKSGANLIFEFFTTSGGITFARQAGELQIPALLVGLNVEAHKDGFWGNTKGKGNYVITMGYFISGVQYNELTKPFVDRYIKQFNETPTYVSDIYGIILYGLVPTIEAVGSLDPDKIIAHLENRVYKVPSGLVKYEKNAQGKPTHDLTWGPGYLLPMGGQWQEGKFVGVWPYKWKSTPTSKEVTYKGIVPLKLPPWMKK